MQCITYLANSAGKQKAADVPCCGGVLRLSLLPNWESQVLRKPRCDDPQYYGLLRYFEEVYAVERQANGKPLTAETLIRFHDLRHTCATLLLASGENPKVVSEMLGHASVSFTMDTYSHVMPSMKRQTADKMNELLAVKIG